MRKILALLTATVLVSISTANAIACGTPSSSKINGKENVATEFTLINNVIVTDDNAPVIESIFEQAKAEERIPQSLTLDIFTVSDSENLLKPVNDNTPQDGCVVLTVLYDDIQYIGSIIIHFTVVKKASIDLSQTIQLNDLWDITKYDSINNLYQKIWKVAINNIQPDIPKGYETYDISGFNLPTVTFNQKIDVEMHAVYNGKANAPTAIYSGTIIIKLSVISYRAQVNLRLQQNNLPSKTLYDLVWSEVKNYFATDARVSNNRHDYLINWDSVTEPPFGEDVYLNFLTTPQDENVHHYIRVVGGVTKNPIWLPQTIRLTVPVVVTQREQPNVNKDYIWEMAIREANLINGPELKYFDTTNWETSLNQNWPIIGGSKVVTLNTINLNTNLMFRGDITIEVELINQGTFTSLPFDSVLLVRQDNHNVDSVLNLVWNNVINMPEWGPNFSKQLSNFRVERKDALKQALEATEHNGDWATYHIRLLGNQEDGSGRDVDVIVQGNIKMINNPIKTDLSIDLTGKNYNFDSAKLDTYESQGHYFGRQIWKDVIQQSPFVNQKEVTFGISKNQNDWNIIELGNMIGQIIKDYDHNKGKEIALQFDLMLRNPTNYDGKITVNFKLTSGVATVLGDIDLTDKTVPIFVNNLPTTEVEKDDLLVKIMATLLDERIKKNSALHNNYPNVQLDLKIYNAFTDEVFNQIALPSKTDKIKESTITIQTKTSLFKGTIKFKAKLIYQP